MKFIASFRTLSRFKMGLVLIFLSSFLGVVLLIQFLNPVVAAPHSSFAQGRIGLPTITIGSVSIRPVSATLTQKLPVCLVLIAVEMRGPAFGISDSGIFLMGSKRTYPATSITPIGQDALFGQQKIRAFGFNPTELCQQGDLKIEDLALLVVRPAGIGVLSFAMPKTAKAAK